MTVIMATYGRPFAAERAARSVIAQTYPKWRLLIVGDHCLDDTGERVMALGDPRIEFINLPERFGEQAGPNSIGVALAQTNYVAFLNHDDLWLDDHLEALVDQLDDGIELYWAGTAFFTGRGPREDAVLFTGKTAQDRTLDGVLDGPFNYAEPISGWGARRDLLERAGPMPLASSGIRSHRSRPMRGACGAWRRCSRPVITSPS